MQGFKIAGNKGIWIIAGCQIPLMAGPEYARYVGINSLQPVGVYLPGDQVYPGGVPFDPLGFSSKPDTFLDQQVCCSPHCASICSWRSSAAASRQSRGGSALCCCVWLCTLQCAGAVHIAIKALRALVQGVSRI